MFLIIYAHPKISGCHNSLLLEKVKSVLSKQKKEYEIIDLYREGFNPVISSDEIDGKCSDELVKKYQEKIKFAKTIIIINPVYWYSQPAILKGFFDKIFTPGFAYNFKKIPPIAKALDGLIKWLFGIRFFYPLLSRAVPVERHLKGKKAIILNTFGGGESGYALYGFSPKYTMDYAVLEFSGIMPIKRINWFNARTGGIPSPIEKTIEHVLTFI